MDDGFRLLTNAKLFCWLPILADLLAPYPDVRIIVSSDWARLFDDEALAKLLGPLCARFAGIVEVRGQGRRLDIERDVAKRGLTRWIALDDDDSCKRAKRFIRCNPQFGVSEERVRQRLARTLANSLGRS